MTQPRRQVIPPFDSEKIVRTLDRHKVEYLLVGGLSTRAYGARRVTYDLDCLPIVDDENLARLTAALKELGARLRIDGLSDAEVNGLAIDLESVLQQAEISNWITDAGAVDVMRSMSDSSGRSLTYEDLVDRANELDVDGVLVRVAALEDVIASKQWADRDKDRDALDELKALRGTHVASPPPPERGSAAANEPSRIERQLPPGDASNPHPTPWPGREPPTLGRQ